MLGQTTLLFCFGDLPCFYFFLPAAGLLRQEATLTSTNGSDFPGPKGMACNTQALYNCLPSFPCSSLGIRFHGKTRLYGNALCDSRSVWLVYPGRHSPPNYAQEPYFPKVNFQDWQVRPQYSFHPCLLSLAREGPKPIPQPLTFSQCLEHVPFQQARPFCLRA